MKDVLLTRAIKEVVDKELAALDIVLSELVEPISDVGNPEKLLGKPYDAWTPEDLGMLSQVYGKDDNTPLANTIFKRTLERVQEMEKSELSV